MGKLKGLPKSRLYRLLRRGEVRVNGGRVGPGYRLRAGDRVRIPPVRLAVPESARTVSKPTQVPVLFEDESILVLNKPAGLAVHGGTGVDSGLIESMRSERPDINFLELAHRLDRATSGCLLLAKSRPVLLSLHQMLRGDDSEITKEYLAVLVGSLDQSVLEVTAPLRKNVVKSGERMVVADRQGYRANTRINLIEAFQALTMVRITLLTGRTHQARVHTNHIGHPILGDTKYGDRAFNRFFKSLGINRLCLHASCLRFRHPEGGNPIEISAPAPPEFRYRSVLDSAGPP